ncbi:MAG: SEC-C domain-containing protein [Dethiosulfatibacter sp.]|nr:SEC-C domain-containing protein [Dethiosulfatibacter sp.]
MTEQKQIEIFEQYNRKGDVIRCPYGRARIRQSLDSYAKAAVNLYGIISREDFVDIFNRQNIDQTTYEEIYILLLPLVLKEGWYGFYKEYIVHYWFFEDFEEADFLLKHQANKPRHIPEKTEFIKHVNEYYEDNDCWWNVQTFIWNFFGYSRDTIEAYKEVRDFMTFGDEISELGSILGRYNLFFRDEQQMQEFINLIMLAKNNTRIWDNKGYTPSELYEIISKRDEDIIKFPVLQKKKVGRNEPCPCGSGKKYKKCCAIFEDTKTAQLTPTECREFYETWFGLIAFVNERERVVNDKIKPEYPNSVSEIVVLKVREVLWEKPKIIDEYITEMQLPQETINILKLWRKNYKKGMFVIMEHQVDYAVVIASNEQGEDRLYGIKGISNSIAYTLRRELPALIETVMLPFKGKIIYDSFLSPIPIGFADGAKAAFQEMYDKAKKHGIITSLE